jgi:hypothetical protein
MYVFFERIYPCHLPAEPNLTCCSNGPKTIKLIQKRYKTVSDCTTYYLSGTSLTTDVTIARASDVITVK